MRADLLDALTERWNTALDARLQLDPHSPLKVLDELLANRLRQRRKEEQFQDHHTSFTQRAVMYVRPRLRKRA